MTVHCDPKIQLNRLWPCYIYAILWFFVIGGSMSQLEALQWQTDYVKVCQLSKEENKPILLFFTGSDWSGNAMRFEHEILDDPAFCEKIGKGFICMEVDFPQHTSLPDETLKQNENLKNKFRIHAIPTLLLIDGEERIIAQMGYVPEKAIQLAADLIEIVEQDRQLVQGLAHLERDPQKLKKLYQIAQGLGRQSAIDQILATGLQTDDSYFLLEKYRLLVEGGAIHTTTALSLRKKILAIPEGAQEIHFTLALIDFQQLSQSHTSPDYAVAPLVEYLGRYGKKDNTNTWRIEMMIAQLYMEADKREEALLHAQKALESAPATMHDEIAHCLNYIRSTSN